MAVVDWKNKGKHYPTRVLTEEMRRHARVLEKAFLDHHGAALMREAAIRLEKLPTIQEGKLPEPDWES